MNRKQRGRRRDREAPAISASPPPHNPEAEQAVLGSILLDRDMLGHAAESLRPEEFYSDAHRVIFSAMLDLQKRGEPVDLITVTNRLRDAGTLEAAGGASYVSSLPNVAPVAGNVDAYVQIVREKAQRRALLEAGQLLQHDALNGTGAPDAVARVRALLDESTPRRAAPVDGPVPEGAALLACVEAFLRRFVVFASSYQVTACALWTVHTHVYDRFDVSPFLHVSSPEKRSGKTRLLEVEELLVRAPWRVVSPSEAVLFRKIDADHPTLLLDEVDAVFGRGHDDAHEPLRALLNAGTRRGVTVPRCVGDGAKMQVVAFSVFSPRVLAGIGTLPDTVEDRCIPISLRRRAPQEVVEPFRFRQAAEDARPIREALDRWGLAAGEALERAWPEVPAVLNDRAAELWEPLLAVADLASGEWPGRAREAAVVLHGDPLVQEETAGVSLLRAIRETFQTAGVDRITTADLLAALVDRDDGPWAEWWGEAVAKGNTQGPAARVARLLRRYGIISRDIRTEEGTRKGYVHADLEDAFTRYSPSLPPESRDAATTLDKKGPEAVSMPRHGEVRRGPEMPASPSPANDVAVSRLQSAGEGVRALPETDLDPVLAEAVRRWGPPVEVRSHDHE